MVRLKGKEMSEEQKETIILTLNERKYNGIRDVNIAVFDTNEIYFIPYGNSGTYTVFVPKALAKMSIENLQKSCKETRCKFEHACIC